MGVRNATILTGATLAATGGTSSTLSVTGVTVPNGVQIADFSVADFRIRPVVTVRSRVPALLKDGTWSKSKQQVSITIPKILANGSTTFPVRRIEIEDHPEMTDAEVTKLNQWAAQILFDADFTNFVKQGSLE